MPHGHGLVQNQLTMDTIALGTLGARAALIINSQFSTPTGTFLMKRIRYFAQLEGRTAIDDGPILIGCANGDATATEIAEAMNSRNVNGPSDITNVLDQDQTWVVYQNTVRPFETTGEATRGQVAAHWTKFAKKGIPALEGSGMVIFAYNSGSGALSTGSTVNGIAQIQGVWLGD